MGIGARLKHAWNAFSDPQTKPTSSWTSGATYSTPPDRSRRFVVGGKTIVSSIYTRMALDVASADIRHVRLDDQGRYLEDISSGLQNCLTLESNIDQSSQAFLIDVAHSLFERGIVAIVPVDTTLNPLTSGGYDIKTWRVGEIIQWYPRDVRVRVYNDADGTHREVRLPKRNVAIVENPLYQVMNEPNSTLQRLLRKLSLLDVVDEQSSSGKLDLIIQVPYVVKSETRRAQAVQRRDDIAFQLRGSQYGIAYTDGTEKITQLNRPAENNLLKQVEYLTGLLYTQLGFTPEIMNGTADEKAMINYYERSIKPILQAIVLEMRRKFLTTTARTQRQSIVYFRDPFKFVPLADLAEIGDKFTRNEIVSSNEMRQVIGMRPSNDPKADQLRNSNMPQSELGAPDPSQSGTSSESTGTSAADDQLLNSAFDEIDGTIDAIFGDLGLDANGN